MKKRTLSLFGAGLLLFFGIATAAFAQAAAGGDPFQGNVGDVSIMVLKEIIGDWTGAEASQTQPLLTEALRFFNLAVLVFGSSIFAYTALVSTLQSAHDGELLGKQWSTVWVPIRFTAGVSLLVPTTSGLCLAQLGMLWMLSQGVALASNLWNTALTAHINHQGNYIALRVTNRDDIVNTILGMQTAELCVAAMNKKNEGSYGAQIYVNNVKTPLQNVSVNSSSLLSENTYNAKIVWGDLNGVLVNDECGSLSLPVVAHLKTPEERAVSLLRYQALLEIRSEMPALALEMISPEASTTGEMESVEVLAGKVKQWVAHYRSTVNQQIKALAIGVEKEFYSDMLEQTSATGWFTAGSWYFQIARINNELNKQANAVGVIEGGDDLQNVKKTFLVDGLNDEDVEMIKNLIQNTRSVYEKMTVAKATSNLINDKLVTQSASTTSGLTSASNWIFGVDDENYEEDSALHYGFDPGHPAPAIMQLQAVGDYMVTTAQALLFASAVSEVVLPSDTLQQAAEKVPGLGLKAKILGALKKAMGLLMWVAIALFAFGVILAFWLPMLPFINWVGGIVGWVVSSLEMLIATPIWIAAHLHPDGDGVASRHAASGYMVILELMLRPTLMVFGLIVAMVIVDPLLNVIAAMYLPAFQTTVEGTASGILTLVMKLIIYATLCWIAINFTFKAITSVPEGAMEWLGGHRGHNSGMAEELGENVKSTVIMGVHKTSAGFGQLRGATALGKLKDTTS